MLNIKNKTTNLIAGFLLVFMFITALLSMAGDALTFDEVAHIGAGYSYLTQQDYRMNPEHPPLIKDLAAIPLLFLNLNFPSDSPNWIQESAPAWWVQFDFGNDLLYKSGNNPVFITFLSRFPMILILLAMGYFIFRWARELGGNLTAVLTLLLFSFSPTLIAHGRLVTTDIGAAFGLLFSTYFWLKFLKNPVKKNIIIAGLAFGLALLIKFSLILLVPYFLILALTYSRLYPDMQIGRMRTSFKYFILAMITGIIGFLFVVGPVYQFHIWNYPVDHQVRDIASNIAPKPFGALRNIDIWMADKPLLRPFAQYFEGVLMATQRVSYGNTVYLLGQVSSSGWWYYFPIIYLMKEPLALFFLIALSLIGLFWKFSLKNNIRQGLIDLIKNNFTIFSLILFLVIYWTTAITGKLNIGIRHLMPTIPIMYLLVSLGLKNIIEKIETTKLKSFVSAVISLLFIWYGVSSLSSFPYYISYYNELAHGINNGYKIAVDSNYDWGQDFYRLIKFMEKNKIEEIHLDHFGGASPEYYLGDKYVRLNPRDLKTIPTEGWVAVSASQMQGGRAEAVQGFKETTDYYNWLDQYKPVARAGKSIFIYYLGD
ncbi:MAG: glycosyltransferase family 39 protein [Candidatus Parcubacteria bacterium]|nr:glycosyltransferase family 39 protein [Candidatus Parcubacteria bacterium]